MSKRHTKRPGAGGVLLSRAVGPVGCLRSSNFNSGLRSQDSVWSRTGLRGARNAAWAVPMCVIERLIANSVSLALSQVYTQSPVAACRLYISRRKGGRGAYFVSDLFNAGERALRSYTVHKDKAFPASDELVLQTACIFLLYGKYFHIL